MLVVDDDQAVREGLRMVLEYEDVLVSEAESGEEGLERVRSGGIEVVLLDLRLPGMSGLEVLEQLTTLTERPEVIMISAQADLSTAVQATRKGAFDFLEKPLDQNRLLVTLRNARAHAKLRKQAIILRGTVPTVESILGDADSIKRLKQIIGQVAKTDSKVLITGESGVGKELVARAIHAGSSRAAEHFVEVNCAAIPSELIESELFGHEKGSFTGASAKRIGQFERADRGTLFLDEVGDMSLAAQAKVLRVLELAMLTRVGGTKAIETDVRVIAATNKPLVEEVEAGRFREDLFYRLNVVPIRVAPLREHTEDAALLSRHFLDHFTDKMGRSRLTLGRGAIDMIRKHRWPGNVRELKNVMERISLFCAGPEVLPDEINVLLDSGVRPKQDLGSFSGSHQEFMEWAEHRFLQRKLESNNWNVTRTAKDLEMQRSNLYKKIERYRLQRPEKEASSAVDSRDDE